MKNLVQNISVPNSYNFIPAECNTFWRAGATQLLVAGYNEH